MFRTRFSLSIMKNAGKLSGFVLAAFLLRAAVSMPVLAQKNDISLAISPPLGDLTLQPGQGATLAFNLENTGYSPLKITPTIVRLTTSPQGAPEYDFNAPIPQYFSLQNLNRTFGEEFLLPAGGKDQLVVKIQTPTTAKEEDVYVALFLSVRGEDSTLSVQTLPKAKAGLAANLLLTVSKTGTRQGNLELSELRVPRLVDTFSAISPEVLVKNTGKNLSVIEGSLEIRSSLLTRSVYSMAFLPENVLAGANRMARGSQADTENKDTLVPTKLTYRPPALLGPYQVTVNLKNAPAGTATVWALPITPLSGGLILFVLLKFIRRKSPTKQSLTNVSKSANLE